MDHKIARNLSLRHFRAFVEVARCGSFSRAADALAVSQPALTLTIKQFEDIVGVRLLRRTTRAVSLTAQGEALLPRAEAILQGVETAVLAARKSARDDANRVRIAVLPSVAIRVLPQVIAAYATEAPDVTLRLQDDNGKGVEAQVLEGRADFGISNIWSETPVLSYAPFLRDQMGLICRADHALARRSTPVSWSDLGDQTFVGMADDTGVSRVSLGRRDLPTTVTDPAFTVLTIAALVGIVENGTAISALPALAAPDYLNPSLVYRALSAPRLYRDLHLITATDRPVSPATQAFMAYLTSRSVGISAMFPNHTVVPGSSPD